MGTPFSGPQRKLFQRPRDFTAQISGARPMRKRQRKRPPPRPVKKLARAKNRRHPRQKHQLRPQRQSRKRNRLHDDDNDNDEIGLRGVPARKRSRAYLLPQLWGTPRPFGCGRAKKCAGSAGRSAPAFAENVGTAEQSPAKFLRGQQAGFSRSGSGRARANRAPAGTAGTNQDCVAANRPRFGKRGFVSKARPAGIFARPNQRLSGVSINEQKKGAE